MQTKKGAELGNSTLFHYVSILHISNSGLRLQANDFL